MASLVIWRGLRDFLHTDVSWYMYVAQQFLEGSRLYVDLADINPPLVIYLSVPPILLSRVLGIDPVLTLRAGFILLALACTLFAGKLLRRPLPDSELRPVVVLTLCFVLLPLPAGLFNYNIAAFAQREHLALLLLIPVLTATAHRLAGGELTRVSRILLALVAGVGLALKPHFLAVWGMILVWSLLPISGRDRRFLALETATIASVQLAYWAFVAFSHSSYLGLIPTILATYKAYNPSPRAVLVNGTTALWLVTVGTLVVSRRLHRQTPLFAELCAAAGTGFLIAAVVQAKGWWYQFYPARALLLLSLVIACLHALDTLVPRLAAAVRPRGAALTAGLVACLTAVPLVQSYIGGIPGPVPPLLRVLGSGTMPKGIVSLSAEMHPSFPLTNLTGSRWCSRHPSLWFLPALYQRTGGEAFPARLRPPGLMGSLERSLFDDVTKSFVTMRPEVCIVDTSEGGWFFGRPFPFVAYYSQDPGFRAAFSEYRRTAAVGSFLVYTRDTPRHR